MNGSRAGVLGHFSGRKALVSVIVAVVLVVTSAAAIALSELGASSQVVDTDLTILSVSHEPEEAYEDQLVEWTVLVSIQDHGQQGKGLLFTWDWNDGNYTVYDLKSLEGASTAIDVQTHAWAEPGLYDVVVSVWDGYGAEQNMFHNVSAEVPFFVKPVEVNTPPMPGFEVDPDEGTTETVFSFDATSCSDLEDLPQLLEVRWDWESDGVWDTEYSTDKLAQHQFIDPGVYTVGLEVMDSGGLTNWTSRDVTVIRPAVLIPHDPIIIDGDSEFVPENGVVGGTGTPEDPYMISGWLISVYYGNAIDIRNTDRCFVISDTKLTGDVSVSGTGINLYNDECASIERVNISGFRFGIFAKSLVALDINSCLIEWNADGILALYVESLDANSNTVSYNCVGEGNGAGIDVTEAGTACVSHNTMESNRGSALRLYHCGFADVAYNRAVGWFLVIGTGSVLANNVIESGGIMMWGCSDSLIMQNMIGKEGTVADLFGIEFTTCTNLWILNNTVNSFYYGMGTHYAASPPTDSENVVISGNKIAGCIGSAMRIYYISNLMIADNCMSDCALGLDVTATASSVSVYHNDFIDNNIQASESPLCIGNVWDDGYPSGGNYWSNYQGVDLYSGVDQTDPGPDGIGDTPYILASGSQDNYPLMTPFSYEPSNTRPCADFTVSPQAGTVETVFEFDASSSWDLEDDVEELLVRWDWENDGVWDTDYSTDKTLAHVFAATGIYNVALEVRDTGGLENITSRHVTVYSSTVLTPHDPIHIIGDMDFAATAATESWAGDGTEGDPYIIELLDISGGGVTSPITVEDTTVHFVIRGCLLSDGYLHGVGLYNVANASVSDNTFESCPLYSIYIGESESSSVQNNTVIGGTHCIGVIYSENMFIGNNTVQGAEQRALYLIASTDVTLRENRFYGSGVEMGGSLLSNWNSHDIDDSNTVNDGSLYYLKDLDGGYHQFQDAGQIILANCRDMTIVSYEDPVSGISLGFCSGNMIMGAVVSSVHIGISLSFSSDNFIMEAEVANCFYGVYLENSPGCTIMNTTVSGCVYGMWILQSDGSYVLHSKVLDSSWYGIFLYYTSFSQVRENAIERSLHEGIKLVEACSNHIASNDIIDNAVQAIEESESTGNFWDDGYPAGGNYWSDYQGADYYSGVDQTEPGPDGIGDTPYILASGSQDNYPMMEPVAPEPTNTRPCADFTVSPQAGTVETVFEFDASSSWDLEDDVEELLVRWDWENDGVWDTDYSTDKTLAHVFAATGIHDVALEVRDSGGLTDNTTRDVVVTDSSGYLEPGTYELSFNTTDAVFDLVRQYVYITDKYAKTLHFVNLTTGYVDKTFTFPYMTESLAITADGSRLFVALLPQEHSPYWWDADGHFGYIASIDLATQVKDREFMINEDPGDILATNNGHLVVGSGSGQWTYIRVFDATDGTEISAMSGFRERSRLALHPSENMVYAANVDLYPSDICRYDLTSSGLISYAGESPYHGDHRMDGNVWVSPFGDELVTRGGDVFTAGQPIGTDMIFIASMAPADSLIEGLCYDTATGIIFTGEGASMRYYAMDNHLYLGTVWTDLPVGFVGVCDDIVAMLLRGPWTTVIQLVYHPLPGGADNTYPLASFTATPAIGTTMTDFVFDASSSYDEQDPLSDLEFRWDLDGDGVWDTAYSSEPVTGARYDVAGTYGVRLEVRDTLGWTDDMVVSVAVAFEPDLGSPGPIHDPFVLPYTVTDAVFDPVRPYMYASSKYANKVYFVNLETGLTEKQFDFSHMTESLAVTSDGSRLYAAILMREHSSYWFDGHVGEIACFDLALGVKDGQFKINEDPFDIVVTSNGFVVVSSGSGQWDEIRVYDAQEGTELGSAFIRQQSRLSLHPSQAIVYAANTDVSPSDIERFDLSTTGTITAVGNSPYHGEYAMDGNVWVNPLGDSLVVRGGHVFTAGMPIPEDMCYLTTMTAASVTSVAFDVGNGAVFSIEGSYLKWYDIGSYAALGSISTTAVMEFLGVNGSCVYCLDVQTSTTLISVFDSPIA